MKGEPREPERRSIRLNKAKLLPTEGVYSSYLILWAAQVIMWPLLIFSLGGKAQMQSIRLINNG